MLSLGLIGTALTFILDDACHNDEASSKACNDVLWINDSIEYVMLTSMIIASVLVYKGIFKLDVNPNPISFLDNLLLLICLPAFLLFCILNVISGSQESMLKSSVPTNILIVSCNIWFIGFVYYWLNFILDNSSCDSNCNDSGWT